VTTPVWFAFDDDRILVWPSTSAGKVKRIRNNSRVTVAVCDYKGKVKGTAVEASATVLARDARVKANRLLNRKYWYVKSPWEAVLAAMRLLSRRKSAGDAYIEIRLPPTSN
jgi:PPOX class probable F420-dependent enzyme